MSGATAVISWRRPRSTAGGMTVNEGTGIPKMRARRRRKASDRDMAALLATALEDLARTPCSFWACEGPERVRHMMTCTKCWAMRTIGTVHATLAARERT